MPEAPYAYVRKTYGVDPQIGGRVRLENTAKRGTIARRRTYDNYVWVVFENTKHSVPCHPTSLIYGEPHG